MRKLIYFTALIAMLSSCRGTDDEPDAWGNFESREIMVVSETAGKILSMEVQQGDQVNSGEIIAITDTAMIKLQLAELEASRNSVMTKLNSIDAQNTIIDQQISNLGVNIERVESMLHDKAATQKQLDDLTGQLRVLEKQKEANNTQKLTVRSELEVFNSREAQLNEQLERCYIKSPSQGTVSEKYAEAGEITAMGKALVRIADLENMELKVYISGAQLGELKLGQECRVRIDRGEKDYSEYTGRLIHVSDKAEFTPKIIQTKEERVHLVYAVKILVLNDGTLKNGMPAEAFFDSSN
ncbi:MAG: HlyD family efflux transporter periplasmic adaptor subunit [Bacteroidales bacterium]|nr:HlyD family efflux transporter periplasmic adaptor subunit [Bacteroidales bacterium]